MTNICLISENAKIINGFNSVLDGGLYSLQIIKTGDYENCFKQIPKGSLVYIDINRLSDSPDELTKLLNYLPRMDQYNFAIIDLKSVIKDVGSLFLNGASDYISAAALSKNLDIRRFKKAIDFYPLEMEELGPVSWLSGTDWSTVEEEKEYSFCFFYIQLELNDDWKQKSGKDLKNDIKSAFYKHIEDETQKYGGRIWIREEFKQIALFPYDGKSCPSVLLPISLILNKTIISAEKYSFDEIMEFTAIMHIGSTMYRKKGNTGGIVSEDINMVHHIATSFGEAGNFYITQNAAPYVPEGLMDLFLPMGDFKGLDIYKMKRPKVW